MTKPNLNGTYSIEDLDRREILMMSAALAGSGAVFPRKLAAAEAALQRTPDQILGPFYPLSELPQTSDLTRVSGRSGRAEGQVLNVMGRVLNRAGEPVRNAKVEVWQANAYGRYTHPSDPNPAPLDPNFEGSAALTTDSEGRYFFKTIKPSAYPVGSRKRPAHIHFQVSGRQDRLVTQMYFENDPSNETDPFLNRVGEAERRALLVRKLLDPSPDFEPDSKMVIFDIMLYKG
jgi:protocatechuate 3,4-dioxygenase beta subunit